jgi:hypothetical protein
MAETQTEETGNVIPGETKPETVVENKINGQDAELEAKARRMGWKPSEEFRGPQHLWKDADTYVRAGEQELPVLRERYRALDDRFSKQERELTTTKSAIEDVKKTLSDFVDFSHKSEQRAYDKAKKELMAQMRQATAMADTAAFDAAEARLNQVEQEQRQATVAVTTKVEEKKPDQFQPPPEVQLWVNDNPWFNNDVTLRAYATALHGDLLSRSPNLSIRDNLAEVRKTVMDRFPDKFGGTRMEKKVEKTETKENENRERAAAVSTSSVTTESGNRQAAGKKKTYNDLPAEAKAACDKFVKEIPKYTREEYVELYFSGEET